MTTLQAIKFAAKIQVGTRMQGGKQIMVVTEITDKYIKGYSEYAKLKFNKETEIILEYSRLTNPHYSDSFQIL